MSTKRKFTNAIVLHPNEQDLNTVRSGLTGFYRNNPQFLKNGISIEKKIEEIIEICKVGWICAPKSFLKRVEWKTKWNTKALKSRLDYVDNYYNAEQVKIQEELTDKRKTKDLYPGMSAAALRSILSTEEKKFWQEREAFYKQEFEFNNSSDWALLMQLLLEELTQVRLMKKKMQNQDEDLDFQLNYSYKRMIDAQKALGITREQRENATSETDGNIAQLSQLYERKKKIIEKINRKDQMEEMALQIKHDNKDWPTDIPIEIRDIMSRAEEEFEYVDEDKPKIIIETNDTDANDIQKTEES